MDDTVDFLEYIEITNSAKTADEIFNHYANALAKLGFDLVLMSLMTDHVSIGKPAGHGIIRNYGDDWMQYYTEKGYADVDPVRKQVMLTSHPFLWDRLNASGSYTDDQKVMMYEAQDAGLRCGIGLGIHTPNREIAGFGMASSDGTAEINKNIVSLVKAITTQFHSAYTECEKKHGQCQSQKIIQFTDIEKDILSYMRLGKTNDVIGEILNISTNTVKFHLRNIFTKLDLNNKSYAICKAIRYGLINP